MQSSERESLRSTYRQFETDYLLELKEGELTDVARDEIEKELQDRRLTEGVLIRVQQIKTPVVIL